MTVQRHIVEKRRWLSRHPIVTSFIGLFGVFILIGLFAGGHGSPSTTQPASPAALDAVPAQPATTTSPPPDTSIPPVAEPPGSSAKTIDELFAEAMAKQSSQPVDYSQFTPTAFADFAKNPPFYTGKIRVKAIIGNDFMAAGDRGGTSNYIGTADPNNRTTVEVVLKLDEGSNYQKAVTALNSYDLVAGYGYGVPSDSFTYGNGQSHLLPTIKVVRLDKIGACDAFSCLENSDMVIFPAGVVLSTPARTPTNTPPATFEDPRAFKISGQGFCGQNPSITQVIIGETVGGKHVIPDSAISSWNENLIAFTVPRSVPAGTYDVAIQGYKQGYGYCEVVHWGNIEVH